jgi:hypothetical protein
LRQVGLTWARRQRSHGNQGRIDGTPDTMSFRR